MFFHHLAVVRWDALGLALACHVIKLLLRARAWQNIVRASYPEGGLKYRSALGAYTAGVGINSIAPARGGDLIKLYLVKHRTRGATYPTLGATLVVETIFDFVIGAALMVWALTSGVLPTHEVYSRIPDVDWKFVLRHDRASLIALGVLLVAALVAFLWARRRVAEFREHVAQGFAILHDRRRFLTGVILLQSMSWVFRLATVYFFLEAFRVRATVHNALLAAVVDSLATLFPATPGGAGTKQGLIVYLFRGSAISRTALLAFSVGMNIAITACNIVLGLVSIGLMARTFSFKKLRARAGAEEQPAG